MRQVCRSLCDTVLLWMPETLSSESVMALWQGTVLSSSRTASRAALDSLAYGQAVKVVCVGCFTWAGLLPCSRLLWALSHPPLARECLSEWLLRLGSLF